jgi:hypothetical protein
MNAIASSAAVHSSEAAVNAEIQARAKVLMPSEEGFAETRRRSKTPPRAPVLRPVHLTRSPPSVRKGIQFCI